MPLQPLFDALGTYVGSSFVNLFNRFGYVYQVYVQSEASGRRTIEDVERLTVHNGQGEPVRLGSLVRARFVSGPTALLSYNTHPAIEVAVDTAPGASSGTVIAVIERLASEKLPSDYAVAWTEVAFQEKIAGGNAPLIFGLGGLMIFLLLAGQYESVRLPFVILLATPVAIFEAVGFLALRGSRSTSSGRWGCCSSSGSRPRTRSCSSPSRRIWPEPGRGSAEGRPGRGPTAAPPDPDDVLRLHPRRGAPRHRRRGGGQCPPLDGHGGDRGVFGGDPRHPVHHPDLLRRR
ncbi:hypothetical protein J2X36_003189 [Methylobacterium sp. BE186]|nr:hypothetical protein [Methylobacterium sp. BE186]